MVVRAVTRYLRRTKGASRKTSEATGKRSNELAVPQSPDFGFVLLPEKKEARNEDENTENEHRHVGQEDLESDRAPGGRLVYRPRQDVCGAIVARYGADDRADHSKDSPLHAEPSIPDIRIAVSGQVNPGLGRLTH